MADAYHHSVSSVRKWGGSVDDYLPIHRWFDDSKRSFAGPQHRALRHHAEGIGWMIDVFGVMLTNSDGREIPTRWIGEQHVVEDFGFIPSAADFLGQIPVQPWMTKGARPLSRELGEKEDDA